ncbi:hypothetical protein ACIOG8_26330 [Streptomyces erythrochromogenes]|uniref:hypothetical protein n=1 Tax=Streptomyces erythrochromogenes TaxID=285574 RepID=UPI003829FD0E
MTEKPSLRAYLKRYAAGEIPREEMLATVAAWNFEEEIWDELVIEPTHQDNTFSVLRGGVLQGRITQDEFEEIMRRRGAYGA